MERWLTKFKLPLVALLLLGMGMFFWYVLGQIDTLHCQRAAEAPATVRCTLATTWMRLVPLREQQLGTLQRASLQDSCDSDGCTYRVYLNTDRGGTALGNMYTSDQDGQQRTAGRINQFLAASSPAAMEISTGGGWLLIIPFFLLLAGGVVAVNALRALLNPTE